MRLLSATLVAMFMCAAAAKAQGPDAACAPDVQKFCAGVKQGGGRIMACLREHHSDVSPGCKSVLTKGGAAKPGMGGWFKTCEADVAKLCKDIPAGKGRIAQCLKTHSDQLTPACKAALENRPQHQGTAGTPGAPAEKTGAATPAKDTATTPAPTAKQKK
jgi:hypothetical protein